MFVGISIFHLFSPWSYRVNSILWYKVCVLIDCCVSLTWQQVLLLVFDTNSSDYIKLVGFIESRQVPTSVIVESCDKARRRLDITKNCVINRRSLRLFEITKVPNANPNIEFSHIHILNFCNTSLCSFAQSIFHSASKTLHAWLISGMILILLSWMDDEYTMCILRILLIKP